MTDTPPESPAPSSAATETEEPPSAPEAAEAPAPSPSRAPPPKEAPAGSPVQEEGKRAAHPPTMRRASSKKGGVEQGDFVQSFALSAVSFGHEVMWNTVRGAPYSVKTREGVLLGFRVAYFAREKATRHSGIYFTLMRGTGIVYDSTYRVEEVDHLHFTAGLGTRYGGMPGKRVWIGAEFDFGLDVQRNAWPNGGEEIYYGPQAMPQFCIDIYAAERGSFKLTIPIALGVNAVLFSVRKSSASGIMVVNWDLSPMLLVGVALGG